MSYHEHERAEEEAFQMSRPTPKLSMPTTVELEAEEPTTNNSALESATGQAPDPYNFTALREKPFDEMVTERILLSVGVHRPDKQKFFRVRPGPEYVIDVPIIEYQGDSRQKEMYWVASHLWTSSLVEELRQVRLFVCTYQSATPTEFLWAVRLPTKGGGIEWLNTALQAAELAKTRWGRLVPNLSAGRYEWSAAKGDMGEPAWSGKSIEDLIKLAFKDERLITSMDHPVVKALEGRS